jgi:PAS domain S-box-containing protein
MCFAITAIPIAIIGGIQGFQSQSSFLIGLIFVVTLIVSFLIAYFVTRPIEHLTKNIDKISKGKLDVHLGYSDINEINHLTDSLNRVMASLKLAVYKVGVKKGEIFEDAIKTKEAFEKRQNDLLDSINGWAWETDAKGIITYCSKNVSAMLGYKNRDIIGQNAFDFMTPEDSKKAKQVFNDASHKKIIIKNLENWNIKNDGEKICVLTNGVPIYDDTGNLKGFRGVNTEITEEKRAIIRIKELNDELSELKKEVTDLLNEKDIKKSKSINGPIKTIKLADEKWSEQEFDSVFILNENADIIDCNENMYKKLGYSKDEILSINLSDIDALESKKDLIAKIQKTKKDGNFSFKTIHKRKDGSAILVHENLQYDKNKNELKAIIREDYSSNKTNR